MAPSKILKLLEDPFGPYPDYFILNPEWPRRGGPIVRPTLTSVHMKCEGMDIGLDETELLKEAPPTSRIVQYPVKVFGVLEIEKLEWLSQTGRKWLVADLRKRDDEKKFAHRPSQLTLESIYGDGVNSGSRISVWLKFDKVMSAAYMTLEDDPTSLIFRAKDCNRSFRIKNLDPMSFNLSRNFIERYRIRRLIHELIDGCNTPIVDRDIEWLINQYLAQVAPMDKYFRIIHDPDSPSTVLNKKGDAVLKAPRHPRPLHRAAIRRLFAAQAEWILADQIASSMSSGRYLNIQSWVEFIKQVRIARRNARAQGVIWGEPWNQNYEDVDDGTIDLSRFGGTKENWNQRLRNAIFNEKSARKRERSVSGVPILVEPIQQKTSTSAPSTSAKQPSGKDSQVSLSVPSRQESEKIPPQRIVRVEYHYDSDFSEASTPSASDSELETGTGHDHCLERRIPWYCRVPPVLEPTQHVWRCPGCDDYKIDLLNLTEADIQDIPEDSVEVLRSKNWTRVTENSVMIAFGHLVNNHYTGHLRALGVQLVREGNKVLVRRWPEEKKRKSRRLKKGSVSIVSQRR